MLPELNSFLNFRAVLPKCHLDIFNPISSDSSHLLYHTPLQSSAPVAFPFLTSVIHIPVTQKRSLRHLQLPSITFTPSSHTQFNFVSIFKHIIKYLLCTICLIRNHTNVWEENIRKTQILCIFSPKCGLNSFFAVYSQGHSPYMDLHYLLYVLTPLHIPITLCQHVSQWNWFFFPKSQVGSFHHAVKTISGILSVDAKHREQCW